MINIKLISVNLPESYINIVETLVTEGKFPNRSEAIRVAIRDLIKTEYLIDEAVRKNLTPILLESEEIQGDLII